MLPAGSPSLSSPAEPRPLPGLKLLSPFKPCFLRCARCQACNWGNSSPPGPPRRRCQRNGRLAAPTSERAAASHRAHSPPPGHWRSARGGGGSASAGRGAAGPGTARAHQLQPPGCADRAPERGRGAARRGGRVSRVRPAESRADPPAVGGAAGSRSPHLSDRGCRESVWRRSPWHGRQGERGEREEARPVLRLTPRPAGGPGRRSPSSTAPWPRSCCSSSACSRACTRGKWRRGPHSPGLWARLEGGGGRCLPVRNPRAPRRRLGCDIARLGQTRRRGEVGQHLTCPIAPLHGRLPFQAGWLQPSLQLRMWGLWD